MTNRKYQRHLMRCQKYQFNQQLHDLLKRWGVTASQLKRHNPKAIHKLNIWLRKSAYSFQSSLDNLPEDADTTSLNKCVDELENCIEVLEKKEEEIKNTTQLEEKIENVFFLYKGYGGKKCKNNIIQLFERAYNLKTKPVIHASYTEYGPHQDQFKVYVRDLIQQLNQMKIRKAPVAPIAIPDPVYKNRPKGKVTDDSIQPTMRSIQLENELQILNRQIKALQPETKMYKDWKQKIQDTRIQLIEQKIKLTESSKATKYGTVQQLKQEIKDIQESEDRHAYEIKQQIHTRLENKKKCFEKKKRLENEIGQIHTYFYTRWKNLENQYNQKNIEHGKKIKEISDVKVQLGKLNRLTRKRKIKKLNIQITQLNKDATNLEEEAKNLEVCYIALLNYEDNINNDCYNEKDIKMYNNLITCKKKLEEIDNCQQLF